MLTEREWGVRYHRDHIGRLMHGPNWSHQKPERRALERDEQAIARWKQKDWPQQKKRCVAGCPPRLCRGIRVPVDPQRGQDVGPAGPDRGPAPLVSARENLRYLARLRQFLSNNTSALLPPLVRQHPAGGGVSYFAICSDTCTSPLTSRWRLPTCIAARRFPTRNCSKVCVLSSTWSSECRSTWRLTRGIPPSSSNAGGGLRIGNEQRRTRRISLGQKSSSG